MLIPTYDFYIVFGMRANPGGYICPEEVVGRDELIKAIWTRLAAQSILLTSERRIGKTCVIQKMKQASPSQDTCILRDLEGLHSPGEFVEAVYNDVEPSLSRGERTKQKFFHLFQKLGGVELKDLKVPAMQRHWKELLIALICDAVEEQKGRVIVFWGETPLFIYNVAKQCGPSEAMAVLDTLRFLRQSFRSLRMVLTGSVGMHQVVQTLRKSGYANAPTNDMGIIEVPPLSRMDGKKLASALLAGEGIELTENLDLVASEIAECASFIPFYIHYIVTRLREDGREVGIPEVKAHTAGLIQDPNDPADFGYYEKRLSTYYERAEAQMALLVLDVLAEGEPLLSLEQLINLTKHRSVDASREQLRDLLVTLAKDHYISKDENGRYFFRHDIVRRWWRFARIT